MDQHQRLFELDDLVVLIGDEVRREVAAIELHAFDHVDGGLRLLAFFDRDHAVLADLHEGIGQHGADGRIVVAGDRGDLGDFLLALFVDGRGHLADGRHDGLGRLGDAAGQRHGIGPAGDHLQALAIEGLGQHGGRGGAVAGDLVGLRGGLFDELGPEVLLGVVQADFFGDGHAVLGDFGGAPALVEDRVSASGSQGRHDGPGQLADAGGQRLPSFVLIHHLFCHSGILLLRA